MSRWLLAAALAWLALSLVVPTWSGRPAAFAFTALLIALNATVLLHAMTVRRILLVPLSCEQIALFGLLSYQLAAAFGSDHFRYDREPGILDWIEFTIAHALRAADLLDALDQYGLAIQTISHASTSSSLILAAMHMTVDVFLFGLLMRWAKRLWGERPNETRLEQERRVFAWVLITFALLVGCVVALGLSPLDCLLWPLDNLLRLVDVGDLFQLFGWQLHSAPTNAWTSAAAIAFRIAAGIWMARVVIYLRTTILRTWGLSIDELIQLLDDPEADVRRGAARGLGNTGAMAARAVPGLIGLLHDIDLTVRCEAAHALGRIGPAARAATAELVDAAWGERRDLREAAMTALTRIGPHAAWAHSLTFLWLVGDTETRHAVAATLAKIAPQVLKHLQPPEAAPKRKPWHDSLDAAQSQLERQDAVEAWIVRLWQEGFFTEDRDTTALQSALAKRGQRVQLQQLFVPLLALSQQGILTRRRGERGRWLYRQPA